MAHTITTMASGGDLVRKALAFLHEELKFIKTINRQYDARFDQQGANAGKGGGSLLVKNPNQFAVTSGATMTENVTQTETYQTINRTTQSHVALPSYTSVELSNSVQDYEENYLRPAMAVLAADVENTILSNVYKDVYNMSGIVNTTPDTLLSARLGNVKLSQGLAPATDRHIMMDSSAMATTVNTMNAYFHKGSELEKSFTEGYIGRAAGMKWWENNMMPTHTNGTRNDTTPVVNTSTGITSGTAVITMTVFGDGLTYEKGDVFTIADVYAVHPVTKVRYSHLQQFTVTADETETGTGDMSPAVSPTPYTSGAQQNVELVSAAAGKVVLNLTAGGSGAASGVTTQALAYHRDAFTFVTADLPLSKAEQMSRAQIDGISIRYWEQGDIANDRFPARIDILYGYKTLRPEWACRVRSDA